MKYYYSQARLLYLITDSGPTILAVQKLFEAPCRGQSIESSLRFCGCGEQSVKRNRDISNPSGCVVATLSPITSVVTAADVSQLTLGSTGREFQRGLGRYNTSLNAAEYGQQSTFDRS